MTLLLVLPFNFIVTCFVFFSTDNLPFYNTVFSLRTIHTRWKKAKEDQKNNEMEGNKLFPKSSQYCTKIYSLFHVESK